MSVTYTAVLDVSEDGVGFVAGLLEQERRRRGTRANTRVLIAGSPPWGRWLVRRRQIEPFRVTITDSV